MTSLSVALEDSASTRDVEAVRAVFADVPEVEVRASYSEKSLIVAALIMLSGGLVWTAKTAAQAYIEGFAGAAGEDHYVLLKERLKRAKQARSLDEDAVRLVFYDEPSGVSVVGLDDTTDEGARELGRYVLDLQRAAGDYGQITWRDGHWWRTVDQPGPRVVNGAEPLDPDDWPLPN